MTHSAATPPGFTVTFDVSVVKVEGRRITFSVRGHDDIDGLCEGTHERFVIDRERFMRKVQEKAAARPS